MFLEKYLLVSLNYNAMILFLFYFCIDFSLDTLLNGIWSILMDK